MKCQTVLLSTFAVNKLYYATRSVRTVENIFCRCQGGLCCHEMPLSCGSIHPTSACRRWHCGPAAMCRLRHLCYGPWVRISLPSCQFDMDHIYYRTVCILLELWTLIRAPPSFQSQNACCPQPELYRTVTSHQSEL